MAVFLPLVLLGPVLLLLTAVLALGAHGPLGWLAAAGLLVVLAWAARALIRGVRAWWRSKTVHHDTEPRWSRRTSGYGHDGPSRE